MRKRFEVTAKLINAFVFSTRIVQFLFFLKPKFQVSSHLLCLYSSVCVRTVRKPHCWFSHEAANLKLTEYRYSSFFFFLLRLLKPRITIPVNTSNDMMMPPDTDDAMINASEKNIKKKINALGIVTRRLIG